MSKAIKINEQVKVIARFEDEDEHNFLCQPLKMEFRGSEVTFSKFRINYSNTVEAGQKVFDLFDQERRYRLIFNMDNLSWLLASIKTRSQA
jgi:hypothetical protein